MRRASVRMKSRRLPDPPDKTRNGSSMCSEHPSPTDGHRLNLFFLGLIIKSQRRRTGEEEEVVPRMS